MTEKQLENPIGNVKIAEEVIASIASITTLSINGVAGMSAGLIDGIAGLLSPKKNMSKGRGVKVTLGENDVAVEISIIVDYGCKIPDVAWDVQQTVKKEIETMTGLTVARVDIRIDGASQTKMPKAPDFVEEAEEDAPCEDEAAEE